MTQKSKRPASVWIAMISLVLLMLGIAVPTLYGLVQAPASDKEMTLIVVGIVVFYSIFLGIALLGLVLRNPFGRWLTILFFIIAIATMGNNMWIDPRLKGPDAVYAMWPLIFIVPLAALALVLIFSRKVSAFFAPQPVESYEESLQGESE